MDSPLCFASAQRLGSHMVVLGRLGSSIHRRAVAPRVVPAQGDQRFMELELLPDSELTHTQP